jgi:DNA repair exonuclease SbcCD ATPase subunit
LDAVNAAYTETVAKETAALNVNFGALNNTTLSLTQRKEALSALIEQFPEYFGGLDAEKATVQELQLAYEATTIAIKQKAIQSALGAEREKIVSKQVAAQLDFEAKQLAFRNRLLEQGRTAAEADAIISRNLLEGRGVAAQSYLDIIEETAKAEAALNELEKKLTNNITDGDKAKVKAAEDAAKARVKDEKAQAAAAEKAKQRRESEAADRARARKAIADEAAENERLKGTLAGLQKELAKINELLTSGVKVTDKERLAELGAEYQRVTGEIEKAQAAIDAVTKARKADEVQIIQNAKIGNIETELLRGKIAANLKLAETLEIQRQRELNLIESTRQKNLAAVKDETARNIINAAAAKEREDFEAKSAENILRLRINLQKQKLELAAREKQDTTEIANEVLKLEAELLALTGKQYDIKVGIDGKSVKTTQEKLKEVVNQVADVVEELSGQVIDFISSQNAAALAQADAAVSKQQELLNGLLANEEQTNTEQVRLEQERLDKLNEAREKAKENEAKIAQAQIAINLALAVARAVAEGGGVASAITVGLALTAAIFGFLKAKQTAEQAFFEGTTYATRAKGEPAGRDTIHARINEGEAIIPTETNRQYSKAIEAIYHKKIPAQALNSWVGDYLSGANTARENVESAANANKREFSIVHLSRQLAQPATAPTRANPNEARMIAELFISEFRKLPQQQLKAGDIVTAIQSKADAKGKTRKRLGL